MNDTERLDWCQKMIGRALCERIFECGFRIPLTGNLRDTIDAAMADAASVLPKSND